MRGKQAGFGGGLQAERNIPAYAGKTLTMRVTTLEEREHPRVCGENSICSGIVLYNRGTSPRMRGKPIADNQGELEKRNIPAYAGKTATRPARSHRREEHPRVCGENLFTGFLYSVVSGTSPRMRGKQV